MTPLTRIQLILLAILAVLVVWRMTTPDPTPPGFLQMTDLDNKQLYAKAFEVKEATSLRIDVRGAFENDATDAPLAAYGWIVDAVTGEPVWTMPDTRAHPQDILTTVQDQIDIAPGRYVAYFTALGPNPESWDDDSFLGLSPHWKHYRDKFHMVLDTDGNASESADRTVQLDDHENLLWSVHGVGDRMRETVFLRTLSTTPIYVQATAEWCSTECDVAKITDLETGRDVWELTRENSEPAGGWEANRLFNGVVMLEPGVFQAEFRTDRRHDAGRWIANPPWVPAKWGMSLRTDEPDVTVVNPWSDALGAPAVSLLEVSSGVKESKLFQLERRMMILVHALGEIGSDGTLYDHATVSQAESGTVLWSMSRESSEPGGGHSTNRSQSGVLHLEPGTYRLSFETDDSHAWNDWRKARPRHPERWGVALFILDQEGEGGITVLDDSTAPNTAAESVQSSGTVLVRAERLTNDVQIMEEFTLDAASTIHIRASGEISRQGRYDFGWIESAASGERVWEMTLDNTVHAGGDDRNRIYDGSMQLPEGTYRVHFVTDFDYAWGDFDTAPPKYPDAWGITVTLK